MEHTHVSFSKILARLKGVSMLLAAAVMVLSICGCGAKTITKTFLRQEVDLSYINRIAVLPLENHTKNDFAAERIRDIITTQILAMRLFDVVDKGIVDSALRELAVEPGTSIDTPILKRLGQRLNVQAFLLGAVDQMGESRKGASVYPEVSLTLRLVDSKAALVLWRASGHRSGYSLWDRLFGLAPQDTFEVSLALVHDMLSTIPVKRGASVAGGEKKD